MSLGGGGRGDSTFISPSSSVIEEVLINLCRVNQYANVHHFITNFIISSNWKSLSVISADPQVTES